ncbi:MAG: Fe-S cluster assembly protein SufB [Alphaproteobacteria bacterium]|nr:Fe-S cluster assembly protein SufB [Alphaproteobacteria bacterium]MBN2779691.1 Fe-S cluster assembly protein SufB [Alphaproteobacteria bacterium]
MDNKIKQKLSTHSFQKSAPILETDSIQKGLNEDVIRYISSIKKEPKEILDMRLRAYALWLKMDEPHWAAFNYPKINYQDYSYYATPKNQGAEPKSLDEIDPKILEIYKRLGVPIEEQKMLSGIAVDAVIDSQSVATTYRAELEKHGIIFCSFSDAIQNHFDLVMAHMGSVVPIADNFYGALNTAVFSDGTFVYIPKGVKCPIELSTYFRLNTKAVGQFERTLIIADEGSELSYLEGCSAPQYDENQLHAAIVEVIAKPKSKVYYSTVQNWYGGDENGKGGVYNFVTKRAHVEDDAYMRWTQLEVGSRYTWKYPSCVLKGNGSKGDFFSVAMTNHAQEADTGTKMIHIGKNTTSRIVAKGISAGKSAQTYRGLVDIKKSATNSTSMVECDNLIIGETAGGHTLPTNICRNSSSSIAHEASTARINPEQLFYLKSRGLDEDTATSLIVSGFCKDVLSLLPHEFAMEAKQLVALHLEGKL